MSDQQNSAENQSAEMQLALAEMLAKVQGQMQGAGGAGGWGAAGAPGIKMDEIRIPLKLRTPIGDVRCSVTLPGDLVKNPDELMALLERMAAQGWPLDAWTTSNSGWSNRSGSGTKGGWNNGRRW